MDRQTNQMASVFSSVLQQESPLKHGVSPQYFCCHIMKILSSIDESFNMCKENKNEVELMTLSAITGLYHYSWMLEQTSLQTHDEGNKSNAAQVDTTISVQFDMKADVQMWYKKAIEEIATSNSTLLLVNILSKCDCKFVEFLAKKAILTGLKSGNIEVRSILECIEVQISSTECLSTSVVELLKDTISQSLKSDESQAKRNLSWLKQHNVLAVLSQSVFNTHMTQYTGLIGYFIFIKKLVKLGMKCLPTEDKIEFIEPLFFQFMFPALTQNLKDSDGCAKHTILSQYFKAVNIFIVSNWVTSANSAPRSALRVIQEIHSFAPFLLDMLDECGAVHSFNFIGKRVQGASDNYRSTNQSCSSLLKHAIGVFLKSCAALMQSKERSEDLLHLLQPLLQAILLTEGASVTSATGWLETHFGDQDYHWISSLCSLLIIHREIKKNNKSQLDAASTSLRSFLFLFEPHQLFLHFVQFVDYDHLVFSDFLISPETNFLTYFLLYIHYVVDDWENFCTSTSTIEPKQTHTFFATIASILSKTCPTNEGGHTSHIVSNLVNQYEVSSNIPKNDSASLVCYSDTDSDDQSVPCKKKKAAINPSILSPDREVKPEECCEHSISNIILSKDDKESNVYRYPKQDKLDMVMGLIIRLRMHISRLEKRGLFPYKVKPLIKVLETCEELYETT